MRIGIIANLSGGDTPSLDTLLEQIATRARERFATVWMAHIRGEDTLITLALAGRNAPDVELGTAVIPIYTRHPLLMAQQALTTQAAVGGRLALGLGLSHKPVVEGNWGLSFERPGRVHAGVSGGADAAPARRGRSTSRASTSRSTPN